MSPPGYNPFRDCQVSQQLSSNGHGEPTAQGSPATSMAQLSRSPCANSPYSVSYTSQENQRPTPQGTPASYEDFGHRAAVPKKYYPNGLGRVQQPQLKKPHGQEAPDSNHGGFGHGSTTPAPYYQNESGIVQPLQSLNTTQVSSRAPYHNAFGSSQQMKQEFQDTSPINRGQYGHGSSPLPIFDQDNYAQAWQVAKPQPETPNSKYGNNDDGHHSDPRTPGGCLPDGRPQPLQPKWQPDGPPGVLRRGGWGRG